MSFPINYSFVTPKELTLENDDGHDELVTILVLDTKANDSYWKRIASFKHTLQAAYAVSNGTVEPEAWCMTSEFLTNVATQDLIEDGTIMELPIYKLGDEGEICQLQLKDGTTVTNSFW